jgi:FtsZ-binding cell division protein ZapB
MTLSEEIKDVLERIVQDDIGDLGELALKVGGLEEEKDDLEQQLSNAEEQIGGLKEELDKAKSEAYDLQERIEELEVDIDKLKEKDDRQP